MTITEFLLARIDKDEAVARAAIRSGDGSWTAGEQPDPDGDVYDRCAVFGEDLHIYDEGGHDEEQATHIARHDPARVLAECAAKRAIIEEHGALRDVGWQNGAAHDWLWCCSCGSIDDSPEPFPCHTVKHLAAVYASHPDYRAEWAL